VRQWHSYLPDGHAIQVHRLPDGWRVICDHGQASGADLQTVFEAAVGLTESHLSDADRVRLREWIEQHLPQLVREGGDELSDR